MFKILLYVIVLAIALPYGIYMFKHYRKRSLEIGLVMLVFGTFLIIIGVHRYPAEKADTVILIGLVFAAISAAVKLFEQKQIKTKKVAWVTKKEALTRYSELIETYSTLESKSERPMNEYEIAKVRKGKRVGNIIGVGFAIAFLAGAAWVYFLTDNNAYWILIAGSVIGVIAVLINTYTSNRQLKNKTIYVLKGVITDKYLDEVGNSYNHNIIVNKSIYITTSKKLYKSLSFGFIIKAESKDESFNESYNIEILGSIMTEEKPNEIMLAQ